MKLTRNVKIAIGVALALGVGYYFYRKRKQAEEEELDTIDVEAEVLEEEEKQAETKSADADTVADLKVAKDKFGNKVSRIIKLRNEGIQKKCVEQGGFAMGYITQKENLFAVHFASPRPHPRMFQVFDTVGISNTTFNGNYKILNRWIDSAGNIGAIYLKIPYKISSSAEKGVDRTFENIGCIKLMQKNPNPFRR